MSFGDAGGETKKTTQQRIEESNRQSQAEVRALKEKIALQAKQKTSVSDQLKADVATGKEILGADFAEGKLGRLDAGRSEDVKSIIDRRRAGLEGLSAEENQALRERGTQGIQRGTQSALRQLRGQQASSGVRGASAVAQQSGILRAGQQAGANVERDLFLANVGQKKEALSAFESSVGGAEQISRNIQQFNLEQRGRETFGRTAAGLGFAGLSVAERTGKRSAQAAAAAGGGGGGKK